MKIQLVVGALITSLVLSGCLASAPQPRGGNNNAYGGYSTVCKDCGTVIRMDEVADNRVAPGGTGAILGGVVGAIAGHEISDRTGGSKGNQNVSTVVGAAAGAAVGHQVQQNMNGPSWDIQVRMDDGRIVVVNQRNVQGIYQNAPVRVSGGRVVPR